MKRPLRFRRRLALLVAWSLAVAPSESPRAAPAPGTQPLNAIREALDTGRYARGEHLLERLPPRARQSAPALRLRWRLQVETGKVREAMRTARRLARSDRVAGLALQARALLRAGDARAGERVAHEATRLDYRNAEARLTWAQALRALGRPQEAATVVQPLVDAWTAGPPRGAGATWWHHTALALAWAGFARDANDAFRRALDLAPRSADIRLDWARLLADHHNLKDAGGLVQEVLQRNPHRADALALRALLTIRGPARAFEALDLAQRALAVAPGHLLALEARARALLLAESFDAALVALRAARHAAPRYAPFAALEAAVRAVEGDRVGVRRAVRAALRLRPRWGGAWAEVGDALELFHRYDEALAAFRRALDLEPQCVAARVGIAMVHSRTGSDKQALDALRAAATADPFDARVANLLDLYERVLPHYTWVEGHGVRLRCARTELPVVRAVVLPWVEESLARLARRYGPLPWPVRVELFGSARAFAVRTVGQPRLQAAGVSFGRVVTARSPSMEGFDFEQVLLHELSHSFHLARSHARVPRWFTEGLAMQETRRVRSAWALPAGLALWRAAHRGELPRLARFDLAFTQARSLRAIAQAYDLASLVVAFIEERHGEQATVRMLDEWGRGLDTAAVVRKALGTDLAALDDAFRTWLLARYAPLAGRFDPDPARWRSLDAWRRRHAANPDDPRTAANAVLALLLAGRKDEALRIAQELPSGEAAPLVVRYARAQAARARGATRAWARQLDALARTPGVGVAVVAESAQAWSAVGAWDEALVRWREVLARDPTDTRAAHAIVELALRPATPPREALVALAEAARIETTDVRPALEWARRTCALRQWATCREAAGLALELAPFRPEVHLLVARSARALGRCDEARRHASLGRGLHPSDPAVFDALLADLAHCARDAEGTPHGPTEP